jgi:hypothetical protein
VRKHSISCVSTIAMTTSSQFAFRGHTFIRRSHASGGNSI